MKLAEALQERADLNRRLEQLRHRLCNNAIVQEGEKPAEDPKKLLAEQEECLNRMETLMTRINLTNSRTTAEGKTLTEWIARRDTLKLRIAALRDMADAASRIAQRATRSEIKIFSTVEVPVLQEQLDAACAELRKVDNLIQQANWLTEL